MNIKEVKITGTVPSFFGQPGIKGMDVGEGVMSDAMAAKMWRWFGMPLTEMHIEFDTRRLFSQRYPFTITGRSSAATWWIRDLLADMVKAGAIIETARAQDIEDGGGWFELHPQKYRRRRAA